MALHVLNNCETWRHGKGAVEIVIYGDAPMVAVPVYANGVKTSEFDVCKSGESFIGYAKVPPGMTHTVIDHDAVFCSDPKDERPWPLAGFAELRKSFGV